MNEVSKAFRASPERNPNRELILLEMGTRTHRKEAEEVALLTKKEARTPRPVRNRIECPHLLSKSLYLKLIAGSVVDLGLSFGFRYRRLIPHTNLIERGQQLTYVSRSY